MKGELNRKQFVSGQGKGELNRKQFVSGQGASSDEGWWGGGGESVGMALS